MAMKSETVVEKVERLLGLYGATAKAVAKHAARYKAARGKLDDIAGDLEMYAQHRAVNDDLREKVSKALAAELPDVEDDGADA
jgi:hypothetical protein